mmetsp:Transcript_34491/g.81764  ORF Transcript_34491/g.81764 Transcript_34491/m.81764 type:complete len:572 (-) Transcript_34491:413-2128(-)
MSADGQDAGGVVQWLQKEPAKLKEKFESWLAQQPYAATVALITLGGGTQGAVLGAVMGSLAKAQPAAGQGVSPLASNPAMTGGPLVQARNFGVLTGVNAGLSATVKKLRGGVDDVQTAMIASFGSGIAFSLVSGIGTSVNQPGGPVPAALVTGTMFALFQGAFYKIGEMFGWTGTAAGTPAEDTYLRTRYMLSTLGLEKYEKNFKKGLLDDSTLMLLNENALAECKIPPGPRLHIMNHIESYRNVLKPGMMLPAPPPPASPQLVPGPPPISPAAVDRIRAAVLRDGRITGENFPELVAYLKGFPDGVDGGVLNLWLQDSVGGYQALGYSRFKSLLQDAENAGICRCSTDKGTMWVKALGEPDPQGGAFGAPAPDLPKSQSNPLLPGGSIGTASPTASAGGPGRPWQQWAPHGAPSAEDPVVSGGGGALGGGLPIGPRRSFQGRAAAPFLGGAELEVKNVAAPGAAGRRQPPPIGEGRKPPPPPQHSAAPPGQPPSPGAQAMLMAAEMGADRVSPGGRAPFSSEPDIAPRQWVQLLFGSGGEGSSPNCGPFDLWPSLASTAERLTPAREQAI